MTEFNAETRFGRVVWERALRSNITNLSRFSQTAAEYDTDGNEDFRGDTDKKHCTN